MTKNQIDTSISQCVFEISKALNTLNELTGNASEDKDTYKLTSRLSRAGDSLIDAIDHLDEASVLNKKRK